MKRSIEDSEKKQYYEKRNDLIQRLYNRIKDIIPAIAFDNKLSVEENFLFSRCFRKYVRKTLVHYDYDTLYHLAENSFYFNNFLNKCTNKVLTFIRQEKFKYDKKKRK